MDGWIDGWMHRWTDGWMDGRIDGWMDGRSAREREREIYIYIILYARLLRNCVAMSHEWLIQHLKRSALKWRGVASGDTFWPTCYAQASIGLWSNFEGMPWRILQAIWWLELWVCGSGKFAVNVVKELQGTENDLVRGTKSWLDAVFFFLSDLASQEIPWCKMMQACPLVLLHVGRGLDEARRYFLIYIYIYNLCNPQSCGTWHGEGESKQGSGTIAGGRPDLTKLQDPKSLFRFLATEGCVLPNQAHTKPFNRCDRNRGSAPSSSDDTPLRRRNLTVLKSWKMRGGITKCQNHRGKNVGGFWPFLTYCHDIEEFFLLRRLESWMKVDGKSSERSWCCLFVKCGGQSSAKFSVRCFPFRPGLRLDLVIAEWWNHLNWFSMSLIGAVRLQLDFLISLLITFVYKCCKSAMYFWCQAQVQPSRQGQGGHMK